MTAVKIEKCKRTFSKLFDYQQSHSLPINIILR